MLVDQLDRAATTQDRPAKSTKVLSGFKLALSISSQMSEQAFVKNLSHQLARMATRLGIAVEQNITFTDSTLLLLKLENTGVAVESDIPLVDETGHYFSEISLQAASGIMSVHGRNRGAMEALGVDYVTVMVAVNALTGLLAQAYSVLSGNRESVQGSCSPLGVSLLSAGQYIADATVPETFPFPQGASDILRQPPFISSDGILFELESLDAGPWGQFWQTLEVDMAVAGQGWKAFQLRYAKAVSPLPMVMVDKLKSLPFSEIEAACTASGMHIIKVNTLSEYAKTEQCKAIWQTGPWHFSAWQQAGKTTQTGKISQATDSLNKTENDLPLAGVKIVESCRRIQGPLATHILALLGADVSRIEPPGGDPLRGMPPVVDNCSARFHSINGLKNVVEINIKDAVGKENILSLAEQADVFIHNWAPHKAAELNLDHPNLSAVNPSLIYSYAGGWGNSTAGSEAYNQIPGTDFTVQAVSGVAATIAENQRLPAAQGGSLFTVLDTLGGAVAAQGIVAALLSRRVHGQGCYLETSLLGGANLLMDTRLQQGYFASKHLESLVLSNTIEAVFNTKSQALAVSLPDLNQHPDVADALSLILPISYADQDTLYTTLAQSFMAATASEWAQQLTRLSVSAAVVCEDLTQLSINPSTSEWLHKLSYETVKSPWRFV